IEAFTVENHLGPHSFHRGDLARIGGFRDYNASFDAEQLSSKSYRLSVISCRSGNHAFRFFFVVELRNEIYSAAYFDRAGWLIVLVLYVDFGAYQLVDRRIRMHRGRTEIRLNTTSRYHYIANVRLFQSQLCPFLLISSARLCATKQDSKTRSGTKTIFV